MTTPEMNSGNFFAELKRRNVYKVAIAYAVVGWLVVQIATQVFPFFDIPNWAVRLVVLATIVGFPIALVIAWAFELTPEGLQRTEVADAKPALPRKHTWLYVALIAGVISLGLFFLVRYAAFTRQGAPAEASAKSIAVLPFENLSHDPENAYFSDGIQDEILTRLAKIADLKVISRTSTQRFKSAPGDLRQIAQQLGVSNVLEGSVQKEGDQVRVNVQLINAATDAHLWAETFDRKLTGIFAVESEIAKTVAETLQAKLTGSAEHVLASRPTENPEAHQLYLKGRYFWNKRTAENLRKAIDYFQQAIDKDPTYALAYAGLADGHALMPIYDGTPPKDDIPTALAAARKAVELDDSLAEAHTSLANALLFNVQLAAAEPEFRRAIALNPNYATAHQWFGECVQGEGRLDEALSELQRAHELDPLSLIINASFGMSLGMAGRTEEAIEQLHKTIDMDPAFTVAYVMLGQVLEEKGDLKGAIAEYEKALQLNPKAQLAPLACVYVRSGRKEEARKFLDEMTKLSRQQYVPAYNLAVVHLALGDKDEALRLLEKAYNDRAILLQGGFGSLKTDHRLDPLRGDPRFQKLVERFLAGQP